MVDRDGLARGGLGELNWIIAHRNGLLTPIAVGISDAGGTMPMAALAATVCVGLAWRGRCRSARDPPQDDGRAGPTTW